MSESKRVWVPDTDKVFVQADLIDESDPAKVRKSDGSVLELPLNEVDRVNPAKFARANDIAELTYLNEASVLNNLSTRYADDIIYTYSGLFLVAVNPYKNIPIYGPENIAKYRNKSREECDPHIYAVTDYAFRQMLETRSNQSILITGESGAGKTENTKKSIQYLSAITCASKPAPTKQLGSIDEKILQTNPVLEAFGNAQTVRNNNSSRFGKFIRVEFTKAGEICGASIEWYLLEKSRVIFQGSEERNYHIFYQLLKGAPKNVKERLLIDYSATPSDFAYLRQGAATIKGVDDAAEFGELNSAFQTMGVPRATIDRIMEVVAIVLHLGNIVVKAESVDQGRIPDMEPVEKAAKLLGISADELAKAVLRPKVKAGREVVTQARSAPQARSTLDALAKTIYERLFGYIVDLLNATLRDSDNYADRSSFIGVLDIAGFEIFKNNSFEQLCINYANEKLQQFFNHHMFVLEQEEYLKEEIQWDYIDFGADLQPTIDLIEKANPMGIFSCLDEDCVMPRATDKSFTDKLAERWTNKNPKFKTSRLNQGFIVSHYAAPVEYNTDGWLEKNRDPVSAPITELLVESSNELIKEMFEATHKTAADQPKGGRRGLFRTVAQKYKEQLVNLMSQLENTSPHFVRCIVANQEKRPGLFNNRLVLEQLRCNGVLEGIRIARSGFPNRLDFKDFQQRYQVLSDLQSQLGSMEGQRACSIILKDLKLDPATYKVGISKVFFRNGVLSELEERRDELIKKHLSGFQVMAKGQIVRARVKRELFKQHAGDVLASNFRMWNQNRLDPWWQLLTGMRLLLASKESVRSHQLDMRTQKLEETLRVLREDQHQLKAGKKELADQIESLKQARDGAEMIAADKEEILKRTQARVVELEGVNSRLEADISTVESQMDELLAEKKTVDEQNTKFKDQLKRAAEIIRDLQDNRVDKEEHDAVRQNHEAAQAKNMELQKQIKDLDTNHKDLDTKHTDLTSKHSSLVAQLASLRSELSAHAETIESSKTAKAESEVQAKKLAADLQEAQRQHKSISELHANNTKAVTELESRLKQSDAKVVELEKRDKLLAVVSKELQDLKDTHGALQQRHTDEQKQFQAELYQVKLRAADATALKSKHDSASAEVQEYKSKLSATEDKVASMSNRIANLMKEAERASDLEKRLAAAETENARLRPLESAVSKHAMVQDQLKQLKDALSAKSSELDQHVQRAKIHETRALALEKDLTASKSAATLAESSQRELSIVQRDLAAAKAEVNASRGLKQELEAARTKLEKLEMLEKQRQQAGVSAKRDLRKIEDLEQALADSQHEAIVQADKVSRLEDELNGARQDFGGATTTRAQLEKVQREKARLLEENSRLMLVVQTQSSRSGTAAMTSELDRAREAELKKLQTEVKVLKLKLVKSEKEFQQKLSTLMLQPQTVSRGMGPQLGTQMGAQLELESMRSRQLRSRPSISDGISVTKQRQGSRALRTISGNDRTVSASKSDRELYRKYSAQPEEDPMLAELELALKEEQDHSRELFESLATFRKRAEEYQIKVDTAEVVVTSAKRAEDAARKELETLRRKYEVDVSKLEKEVTATNQSIVLLRRELNDRELEMMDSRRELERTRSSTDEKSQSHRALTTQVHNMQLQLKETLAERDRLHQEKLKLEKRLAAVWNTDYSANAGSKQPQELVQVQTKLEQAERAAAAGAKRADELKLELSHHQQTINTLRDHLRASETQLAEHRQALAEREEQQSQHQVDLRRAARELTGAKEAALRSERELEQYKMRYERATLQRGMSMRRDDSRPAFL